MTVPVAWSDLSETPSNNPPPSTGEAVGHNTALYFQALFAFIRMAYDGQIEIAIPFSANTQKLTGLANAVDPTDMAVVGQAAVTWGAPTSTRALLHQATAPIGWTIDTASAFTDCAVRLNASTGGSTTAGAVGFSGWSKTTPTFTTDGHSLTNAEIPSHVHNFTSKFFLPPPGDGVPGFNIFNNSPQNQYGFGFSTDVGPAPHGQAHTHTYNAPNLKFADLIVVIKS